MFICLCTVCAILIGRSGAIAGSGTNFVSAQILPALFSKNDAQLTALSRLKLSGTSPRKKKKKKNTYSFCLGLKNVKVD